MRKFWVIVLGYGLSTWSWACGDARSPTPLNALPGASAQAGMSGGAAAGALRAGSDAAGRSATGSAGSSAGMLRAGGPALGGTGGTGGPKTCLWTVCEPGLECFNEGCGVCGPPGGVCPTPLEKPCGGGRIGEEIRCNDFVACPGVGNTCMDKPGDECDPANGGKDCVNICKCTRNVTCGPGFAFSTEDAICACAPIGTAGTAGSSSGTAGSAGSSGASGAGNGGRDASTAGTGGRAGGGGAGGV